MAKPNKSKPVVVAATGETVSMKFPLPMYYENLEIPLYMPGIVYNVPKNMVTRWQKRGGVIVTGKEAASAQPTEQSSEPMEPVQLPAQSQPLKDPVEPGADKDETPK